MKICKVCGVEKELEEFHKMSKAKDGHHSMCKCCRAEYDKRFREKRKKYSAELGYVQSYYLTWRDKDPRKVLYNSAKKRAKERGIDFSIVLDDVVIPDVCPIFGVPLTTKTDGSHSAAKASSASLDRIDSTLGYIKGNVAVISYKANVIKNNGTAEEHRRIAQWMEMSSSTTT